MQFWVRLSAGFAPKKSEIWKRLDEQGEGFLVYVPNQKPLS